MMQIPRGALSNAGKSPFPSLPAIAKENGNGIGQGMFSFSYLTNWAETNQASYGGSRKASCACVCEGVGTLYRCVRALNTVLLNLITFPASSLLISDIFTGAVFSRSKQSSSFSKEKAYKQPSPPSRLLGRMMMLVAVPPTEWSVNMTLDTRALHGMLGFWFFW